MNNSNWKPEGEQNTPWEPNSYQTGSTKPPKTHGGLIALLLTGAIFFGGIASVLGLMNIRLFRSSGETPEAQNTPAVAFSAVGDTLPVESRAREALSESLPVPDSDGISLELRESPPGVENVPQEGGLSLQEIYEKTIDSVVSISCTLSGGTSSGTGVVLSKEGYLLTNAHVVEGAQSIDVQLSDGRTFPARVLGSDSVSDLAVLYIQASRLTPAEFGDSSALRVGDAVAAIGDPLGAALRGTMTNGIISAINRDITTGGRTMTLIQTNAALNEGNSGGPLINCYGQVIGINTMKIGDYSSTAGVEGLGFAIPSTTVKEIVDQLIAQGYVSGRPTMDFTFEPLSAFYQAYYRLPQGLYINDVGPAAQEAGLRHGDILVSMDNTATPDSNSLNTLLYSHQVGDSVSLVIYRNGEYDRLTLTLSEAKS